MDEEGSKEEEFCPSHYIPQVVLVVQVYRNRKPVHSEGFSGSGCPGLQEPQTITFIISYCLALSTSPRPPNHYIPQVWSPGSPKDTITFLSCFMLFRFVAFPEALNNYIS